MYADIDLGQQKIVTPHQNKKRGGEEGMRQGERDDHDKVQGRWSCGVQEEK